MGFFKKETEGEKHKRLALNYRENIAEIGRIEKKWVANNYKGIELEKKGEIEEAIKVYEKIVDQEFDGTHPYERLAIIYRKRRLLKDEIRVLEKANIVLKNHSRIEYFKNRLEKATNLYNKKIKMKGQ